MLDIAANYMVRNHIDYSDSFEIRLGLNVCLVNLLTAAKLYVDQLNQNVKHCIPNISDSKNIVKSLFSIEYDKNKEYRFMEALRNHVQHSGLPVHFYQINGEWTSFEEDGMLKYTMNLASQRSYLKENTKFKKEVLSELEEKIDLKASTRVYIESLSNVHEFARGVILESILSARKLIEDTLQRYRAVYNGSLIGLCACKSPGEKELSAVPIFLDWDNIRIKLQKRNPKLTNLRKRYVTGRIKIVKK